MMHHGEADAVVRAEAARAAMARLMAVAGHDLKQPLQVAVMSIARAAKDGIAPGVAARLNVALDALERLGCELDDLARSSQAGSGLQPRPAIFPLRNVLDQVENEWRRYAQATRVDLKVRRSALHVETDPVMLRTILRNLVGNAIKFTRTGGRVLVGCRARGEHVVIEIHDTGRGIPPHRVAAIFDAFDRGGREGAEDGLGLGLHIVRQTAEMLRHPIAVRSVEERGSTFSVTVPLAGRIPSGRA